MKILLTGANGLLGRHLAKKLFQKNHELIASAKDSLKIPGVDKNSIQFRSLDITDGSAVNKLVNELKPGVIIHAAAMTQVDQCELNKIDCWNTNVTATRFLVDAAKEVGSRMIFIST